MLLTLVLPLGLAVIVVNTLAARIPAVRIYGPDPDAHHEQRVLDDGRAAGVFAYWAHPEATDHHEFKVLGVPFIADTRPYPHLLQLTTNYQAFGGVYEDRNTLYEPLGEWDALLEEALRGRRAPVWCLGEMLYHYEGHAGKTFDNVETVIWASEKTAPALLQALHRGAFYARRNHRGQRIEVDNWTVNNAASGETLHLTSSNLDIRLDLDSATPGEKVTVDVVRNGHVVHRAELTTPARLRWTDTPAPELGAAYYRAIIRGQHPLKAVTNPIFVRRD